MQQKPRIAAPSTASSSATDPNRTLREQLQIEIENRSKPCANASYECSLTRVDGYEFCNKHILQNTRSPFKQCSYLYPNGRKCTEPAPKHTTKKDIGISTYCLEHSRMSQLNKLRAVVGKHKTLQTPETVLADLTKYVKPDNYRPAAGVEAPPDAPYIDPLIDVEQLEEKGKRNILDYASDSDSEEQVTLNTSSRNIEQEDSDNESVDSEPEDPLKHAEIYSTEEAAIITREKLKRLQSLYYDQFSRLQHVLKEKRRKYLQDLKKEKETHSCIYNQPLETPQERIQYSKLKAMNHYHKKTGVHAILQKRLQERRAKITDGLLQKPQYFNKCIFTEGGVKCGERALPAAKHCRKHIIEDKKQVLFRICGIERSNVVCQEIVPNIFENATCVLHMGMPPKRTYIHKKYQSDTDEDEEKGKIKTEMAIDPIVKEEIIELSDIKMDVVESIEAEVEIDPTQHYDTCPMEQV